MNKYQEALDRVRNSCDQRLVPNSLYILQDAITKADKYDELMKPKKVIDIEYDNDYAECLDRIDRESFDKIGEVIASSVHGIDSIRLDRFVNIRGDVDTYIVVTFQGGGISVRNANMNSLTANIQELSKMLNGGYYAEVEQYRKAKGESSGNL